VEVPKAVIDLMRLGMQFDLISPTLAVVQDLSNGGAHTFLIPQSCGWTGREIERLLRSRGVKTWGLMAIKDVFTITVHPSQAKRATAILNRAGL
jgi:hypothetical protein